MIHFKNFELRPYPNDNKCWELVKWQNNHTSCFQIATVTADKDGEWHFDSCGIRYLEHRENGLEEYILAMLKVISICNKGGEDDE